MVEQRYDQYTLMRYTSNFSRLHRGVAVAWMIMTVIYCVLNCVTFQQPQWIGDTPDTPRAGHFGAYQYCYPNAASTQGEYACDGSFANFDSILNLYFKLTTIFSGLSALLTLVCVFLLILFFCFRKGYIFTLCGVLLLVSAIFMFLACVIYPAGWDHEEVQRICGDEAGQYRLGLCGIRWAYILAILGIFDAAILAVLAFFLAAKRAKMEEYTTGTISKSELNGYSAETVSKRSIPIQPMVTVPDDRQDRYSEYSQPSKRPGGGGANFQL